MGLLDKKERIFDVQLTDKGRDLLSKNLLNFSYYCFSDDGINYSGSLNERSTAVTNSGAFFDDFVHTNTFCFEPSRIYNKTINYFLFTVPSQNEVIPQFVSNITSSFTLSRNYSIEALENIVKSPSEVEKIIFQENVLDYVIVVEEVYNIQPKIARDKDYVANQIKDLLENK